MRVLLFSCLLIGSITCGPVGKGKGAATGFQQMPFSSGHWFSGLGVGSDPDSSSTPPNPSSEEEAGEVPAQDDVPSAGPGGDDGTDVDDGFDGGYANFDDRPYNSPEASEDGRLHAGYGYYSGSAPGGDYGSSGSAYVGDSWTSAGGGPEPVFSDVSDQEPVYSFSSRSRYQRGRAVFAQTRYTPGEPTFQPMPFRRTSTQSRPSNAPTKGTFFY